MGTHDGYTKIRGGGTLDMQCIQFKTVSRSDLDWTGPQVVLFTDDDQKRMKKKDFG